MSKQEKMADLTGAGKNEALQNFRCEPRGLFF
jgi:hypothetical protein